MPSSKQVSSKSRLQRFLQSTRRHWIHVIGFNWLVALTMLPLSAGLVAGLAFAHIPVAAVICAGYAFHEVTAFCAERNWSHVGFLAFWQFALPFIGLHTALCLLLTRDDALGCLVFAGLCMWIREFLFQVSYSSPRVGGYQLKERLVVALTTAFVYCASLALLAAVSYTLIRMTQDRERRVTQLVLWVIFVGVLPLSRFLSRLFCTQLACSAALAPEPLGPSAEGGTSGSGGAVLDGSRPQLDTLVMYADLAYALTLFLEVGFAFALLLAPHTIIFAVAAAIGAVFDVLFVSVLDSMQKRRLRGVPPSRMPDEVGMVWGPTFCMDRPRSLLATLMSGMLSRSASELTPLTSEEPPRSLTLPNVGATTVPSAPSGAQPRDGSPPRTEEPSPGRGRTFRQCCGSADEEETTATPMSPRVTYFLDEYNDAIIECKVQQHGKRNTGQGNLAVYLYQERKITFSTHLLGNTVALAFAASCVPILLASGDLKFISFKWFELILRIVALLLLRCLTDLIACWSLEATSTEVQPDGRILLWESRWYELSTFHGWIYRMLISACPLFAVVAATFPDQPALLFY